MPIDTEHPTPTAIQFAFGELVNAIANEEINIYPTQNKATVSGCGPYALKFSASDDATDQYVLKQLPIIFGNAGFEAGIKDNTATIKVDRSQLSKLNSVIKSYKPK